jgi:hypothetical protein
MLVILLMLVAVFGFMRTVPAFCANITQFNISPTTISFQDRDPDVSPEVTSATDLIVNMSIRNLLPSQNWVLEIYTDGDLVSGGNAIPIGNCRWTVTGQGTPQGFFQNGTFSRGIYILTGQGSGDVQTRRADVTCVFSFYLRNLWAYFTGNYSRLITLRLTVPGDVRSRTFTLSTSLAGRAKLEFGMLSLSFPDADPDSVPSIAANVNPLSVTSSSRTGSSLTTVLTCRANGDLISGTRSIPIGNVTWQSTGSGYVPGTMNRTTSQTAGTWTGPGKRVGSFGYFLANSWSYAVGNYSTTMTYTLTAP